MAISSSNLLPPNGIPILNNKGKISPIWYEWLRNFSDQALELALPIGVAFGGTGGTTAGAARTALGLEIGTDIHAFDSTLGSLAAYNTNGILTQTSEDTFVGRSIEGTVDQIDITNGDGVSTNPVIKLSDDVVLPGTGAVTIPDGTTGERPSTPTDGMIRYNTTTSTFEGRLSGSWTNFDLSGISELNDLSDVATSSPSAGQVLIYDATASEFENATITAGSGIDITNGDGSITVSGEDATVSNKGIASFSDSDFTVSSGAVSIDQSAFRVYRGSVQSINNATYTKIQFDTENYDTNSDFDSSTNYRFTPTVAGKYRITLAVHFSTCADTQYIIASIYLNGVTYSTSFNRASVASEHCAIVTADVDMNGSTDYIEGFAYQNQGAAQNISADSNTCWMAGSRIVGT